VEKRGIVLSVSVVARGVEDVHTFIDRLAATGAFRDLLAVEEHEDEAGLLESSLETIYAPAGAPAAARVGTDPR
jgi:hypothetical protein